MLLAQVAVEQGRSHDPSGTHSIRVTAQPASPGTPELVSAMSDALGQMADQVAIALRSAVPLDLGGRTAQH